MHRLHTTLLALGLLLAACGDSGGGNHADALGVGAECVSNADCVQSDIDGGLSEECLPQFKGGYCGIEDCLTQEDCPPGAACVIHDDGHNYCFRLCADKAECNVHRSADNEANCSADVDYVDADKATLGKACVPPSSGL